MAGTTPARGVERRDRPLAMAASAVEFKSCRGGASRLGPPRRIAGMLPRPCHARAASRFTTTATSTAWSPAPSSRASCARDGRHGARLESVNYDQRDALGRVRPGNAGSRSWTSTSTRARSTGSTTTRRRSCPPSCEALYAPSDRWSWDETSPSCPPLILRHAREHWASQRRSAFDGDGALSDIVDAAQYESVEQAIFGDDAALRIARSMTSRPLSGLDRRARRGDDPG